MVVSEETAETVDTTENYNEEILADNVETNAEIKETADTDIVESENSESEIANIETVKAEEKPETDEKEVAERLEIKETVTEERENEEIEPQETEEKEIVRFTEESSVKKEDFDALTENQYQLFSTEFTGEISKEIVSQGEKEEQKTAENSFENNFQNDDIESVEEFETDIKEVEEKINDTEKEKNDEILETTEIIDEFSEEPKKEITEVQEEIEKEAPKTVEIEYNSFMGKLETALEIRYSSLKLTTFPIKISNVPEGMTFPDELVIGNTSLKVGEEVINNCYLKVASNESVKMFEIKHREFKLALSVSLNNDTINAYGNVRYYEISSLIKTTRIVKVLEMLENIFNGTPITFKYNRLYGNIVAEDRIEAMRIKTMENFFDVMNRSGYKFQSDKLPQSDNLYYLLELNSALKENRAIETWCNFTLNRENTDVASINEGDSLIIKRVHKFDKNYSIEEKIIMKTPMEKANIFKEKTAGYRKQCWIELRKI